MRQSNSRPSLRKRLHLLARRLRLRGQSVRHMAMGLLGLYATACGSDQPHEIPTLGALPQPMRSGLTVRQAAPVTHVIIVGDSISEGLGAERQDLSYARLLYRNDDQMYPHEKGLDLRSHFGPNLHYLTVAHAGDTSDDVIRHQLPRLADQLAQKAGSRAEGVIAQNGTWQVPGRVLVVMTVGGNDVQSALRPNPNFTGPVLAHSMINLRAIMDFFEDRNHFAGGVSMYFGNVYDTTDGEDQMHSCMPGMAFPGLSQALDVWSDSFAQLAQQRQATLVDLLGLFRGHGFNFANPDNPYFNPRDITLWVYERDCIHPNNRGHHKLRRAFFEHIRRDFP
jgi:lysophospholipase L1-like esterase